MEPGKEMLDKIEQMFLKYGIKSVTMDDIARETGKSKKTIYQYFPNKRALVKHLVTSHLSHREKDIVELIRHSSDAIEEWVNIFKHNCQMIAAFNPSVIFDLQKYYPGSWKVFTGHKENFIQQVVFDNVNRGIKEGLYRDDLNPDIIARMYASRLEMILDRSIFPPEEFTRTEVLTEFIKYHLRGIASTKGLKIIEEKLKEQL